MLGNIDVLIDRLRSIRMCQRNYRTLINAANDVLMALKEYDRLIPVVLPIELESNSGKTRFRLTFKELIDRVERRIGEQRLSQNLIYNVIYELDILREAIADNDLLIDKYNLAINCVGEISSYL